MRRRTRGRRLQPPPQGGVRGPQATAWPWLCARMGLHGVLGPHRFPQLPLAQPAEASASSHRARGRVRAYGVAYARMRAFAARLQRAFRNLQLARVHRRRGASGPLRRLALPTYLHPGSSVTLFKNKLCTDPRLCSTARPQPLITQGWTHAAETGTQAAGRRHTR
ncbi:MAG: hypothetical protein J3K34DRAFT_410206 [Monoraphidium minutum]|nr:MAG: hypothetical protein J3K34DRAFT_410206 [Monoraphidium minutum]